MSAHISNVIESIRLSYFNHCMYITLLKTSMQGCGPVNTNSKLVKVLTLLRAQQGRGSYNVTYTPLYVQQKPPQWGGLILFYELRHHTGQP